MQLQAYAQNVLNIAWSEVFKRMDEFIQKIQPFADLIDNLGPYVSTYSPPWKNLSKILLKSNRSALEVFSRLSNKVVRQGFQMNFAKGFADLQ